MSRIVRFHALGGPEVLQIENIDVAPPGPGEVRLRVKALGLNRAEALLRSGRYIETAPLPSGLGLEAAGVVDAVGADVEDFVPGDSVSVIPPRSMVRWPTYGEVATVPANHAVKHPPSLSWTQAAAIWMASLTAYGALIDIAALRPGDFVVVPAASSSVGLAAIQIALMAGATPIALTRTSAKRQALSDFKAPHVIAVEDEDVEARLAEITDGRGARVVFDPVGGPLVEVFSRAMTPGGILIAYGLLSPLPTPFPITEALGKGLTLRGYVMHEITADPARLKAAKTFILAGLASGRLSAVIDRVFEFEDIVAAHRRLESNEQFGKIVVTV